MAIYTPTGSVTSDSTSGVSTPTIEVLDATTAGTEYSYALPSSTKKFYVYARNCSTLTLTFASGASKFRTIEAGFMYESPNEISGSLTLYLTPSKDGEKIEIESWA